MVLLKEISEGIWGLIIEPNRTSEVVCEHPFRITMAALDIDVNSIDSIPSGITRVTLKSSTADKGPATDLILCNLQYPACLQQPLDIEIYDGQTLTFAVQGQHKVHLTGYNLQPEPEEMHEEGHLPGGQVADYFAQAGESSDEDDDDDDDDESDDDDDDEEEQDVHLARAHRLRDDEDQDLEGDYEDGYVEGEDQLSSDEEPKTSKKTKKRQREESNGHPTKKPKGDEKKTKKEKKEVTATTSNDTNTPSTSAPKKTNSLEIHDIRVGTGPEAKLGKNVAVYYTGRLQSNNKTFDSCVKGKPFRFRLGAGEVIRGWDQGVKGMRVGGKRRLTIPPSLAYGNQKLPDIPANSTLVFDVELKNVL